MFGRKFRCKLPDIRTNPAKTRDDVVRAREQDMRRKMVQKGYKDARGQVREHTMEVGDKVLLERETTKNRSPYDPEEYEITQVHGTQLTISRGDSILVRDSQKVRR